MLYTLKTIAQRGSMLGAAVSLLLAAMVPAGTALADALNPLTERSLLLSSSSPGFNNTDGSNNPTYAPPGSGPNGEKTGETFTFTVSSTAAVKGFSFQYCTTAAGLCKAPGNNAGDERNTDREDNATGHPNGTSDLDIVGTFAQAGAATAPVEGEFQVIVDGTPTSVTDWSMTARNAEDNGWIDGGTADQDGLTGKNNYMTLSSTTGVSLTAGQEVQIVFKADASNYITNPGYGAFFVKINTYDVETEATSYTDSVPLDTNTNVIDGGVTVANVMTDSIHIVTKVLETMSFSVGIQNPDTVELAGAGFHGVCDPISQTNTVTGLSDNRLNLGNPNAEYSLETGRAWDVNSYWRLSSNSSGGATVYYSGDTLANTSGDKISDMPTKTNSLPGSEQFGLGFVDAGLETLATGGDDTWSPDHVTPRSYPFKTLSSQTGAPYDTLAAQTASDDYSDATGTIDNGSGGAGTAQFKFLSSSLTVPEVIAQQEEQVISCATANMRYVGNIAADTPAGVYTTKINYLAAPQY